MVKKTLIIGIIIGLLSLFLIGCGSTSVEKKLSQAAQEGKRIYEQRGCPSCHRIKGKGGRKGPDLTFVGKKYKDKEWYLKYFQNPSSVIPDAKMPQPLVTTEEREKLIEYMLSLDADTK